MYHSIGKPNKKWIWSYLSCPIEVFEKQIKYLIKKKYTFVTLDEYYKWKINKIKIKGKPIIFTFDDGFADNFSNIYPLLKKYNFKITIFINPEFVNKDNDVRYNNSTNGGYLSWKEIEILKNTGNVDFQSHTMTHTWYFSNDKIVDFRHPSDKYIWQTWNNHIEMKPYLQIDNLKYVSFGEPIYENHRAIEKRKFIPDPILSKSLNEYILSNGYVSFFNNINWKKLLFKEYNKIMISNDISNKYETEEEYKIRLKYEIFKSKEIIEKKLKKEVKFLCWPGGISSNEAMEIMLKAKYLMSTKPRNVISNRTTDSRITPILKHYKDSSKVIYNSPKGFDRQLKSFLSPFPLNIYYKYFHYIKKGYYIYLR